MIVKGYYSKRMDKPIYVTRSSMPPYEEYIEAIKPLWDSRWLTNMGKYHQQLEHELAEYLGVPSISLLVNGHTALEMTLQSFRFPKGSEVITTPFTFISTTHAIVRNGLEPVFCDVKESDGTIDEDKIEELITSKTVAIVPVHVYGNLCANDRIMQIAAKHNLKVIYDAAHAFGIRYKDKGIGNWGDASIYSFHATKVFHTVEGGAVVCKNKELYDKLHDLKDFGIIDEELIASVGANGKMNEFCAIMGLCNLKHIEDSIEDRKRIHDRYVKGLSKINGIRILSTPDNSDTVKNYAYFPIVVEEEYPLRRDELHAKLAKNNIYTRKYFYPLTSDCECYKDSHYRGEVPVAERLASQVLTLPIYEGLEDGDTDRVIDRIGS